MYWLIPISNGSTISFELGKLCRKRSSVKINNVITVKMIMPLIFNSFFRFNDKIENPTPARIGATMEIRIMDLSICLT